ncbi:MAG: hypothetical protein HRU15_17255, partial [Planctomycetes bacterium]|nr:hypothetical protein [Planctomycetota bacterium]
MKNINTATLAFLLQCTYICIALAMQMNLHAAENETYQSVYDGISKEDNRLPGSENFERSAKVLEKALQSAGISTYRQTFDTAVPQTKLCEFKVEGKKISGVYPTGPNRSSLSSTGKDPIKGPLIYIHKASNDDFNTYDIKGAIVLVDIDSINTPLVFNEGALAIIYVGNQQANQYTINKYKPDSETSTPTAFITRAQAEQQGLLNNSNNKGKIASLQIHSSWEKKTASNIWAHIPASNPTKFNYGNEAIVLCATLDTFGYIPDYCPQKREAANVALLAQTCVDMSQQTLKRDVFVLFLGSHQSLQEGARYFYFVDKQRQTENYFNIRRDSYNEDIQQADIILSYLSLNNEQQKQADEETVKIARKSTRRILETIISDLNYEIRRTALKIDAGDDTLYEQLDAKRTEKSQWNELRGDLAKHNKPDDSRIELHKNILERTKSHWRSVQNEVRLRIQHNKSFKLLSDHLGDKTIVAHFSFDFADENKNWILHNSGDFQGLYWTTTIGLSFFKDHIDQIQNIYNTVPATKTGKMIQYRHNAMRSEALLYPDRRSLSSFAGLGAQYFSYNLCNLDEPLFHDQLPFDTEYSLRNMREQCSKFFKALCNSKAMSVSFPGPKTGHIKEAVYEKIGGSNYSMKFNNLAKGGKLISGPANNILVGIVGNGHLNEGNPPVLGHSRAAYTFTNSEGLVFSPGIAQGYNTSFGVDHDQYGHISRISAIQRFPETKGVVNLNY